MDALLTEGEGQRLHHYCAECGSRFYGDEENDVLGGRWYCSYCLPDMALCEVCGKYWKKRATKKPKGGLTICVPCQRQYGAFPNIVLTRRFLTLARDNFTCRYCGRSPLDDNEVQLHVDHIDPKAKGGPDCLDNFVTACRDCNMGKLDYMLDEYQRNRVKARTLVCRDMVDA